MAELNYVISNLKRNFVLRENEIRDLSYYRTYWIKQLKKTEFKDKFLNQDFEKQNNILNFIALNFGKEGINLYEDLYNSDIFQERVKFEEDYVGGLRRGDSGYITDIGEIPKDILAKCLSEKICSKEKLENLIIEGNLNIVQGILNDLEFKTINELSLSDRITLKQTEKDNLISFSTGVEIARGYELRKKNEQYKLVKVLKDIHSKAKRKEAAMISVDDKTLDEVLFQKGGLYLSPSSAYFNN